MSNPFNLKKEPPKSPWNSAVMILAKDQGKKSHKKFLFDHNACEALKLDSTSELGFIIDGRSIFLADIKDVDKADWGLTKDDFNKIHKTKVTKVKKGQPYKFSHFNNSKLYNSLVEELELDTESNAVFELTLLKDNLGEFMPNTMIQMLERMGITNLYYVSVFDQMLFDDEKNLKKGRHKYRATIEDLEAWMTTSKTHSNSYGSSNGYYSVQERPMTTGEASKVEFTEEDEL